MTKEEYDLLFKIYHNASTLASNLARENMRVLSGLASKGFITTYNGKDYGRRWLITSSGIHKLYVYNKGN